MAELEDVSILDDVILNRVFRATGSFNAATATELAGYLIRNPAASGKVMELLHVHGIHTNTVGSSVVWRIYRAPTITSTGTSVTPSNCNIGDATASSMRFYTTPVVTANGIIIESGMSSAGTTQNEFRLDEEPPILRLAAGQDLLVTCRADGANRTTEFSIKWREY